MEKSITIVHLRSVKKQIFLTDASTAMWGSSEAEGVDVCLDLLQICRITKSQRVKALNFSLAVTNFYKASVQHQFPGCVIQTDSQQRET